MTLVYELGRRSAGSNTQKMFVGPQSTERTTNVSSLGRTVHYVKFYASHLDFKTNWKFYPSVTGAFQKGQKQFSYMMKFEYRFD
jgi:hypothetical protein